MSDQEKEKQVFSQEVNREELKNAAGGTNDYAGTDGFVCGSAQYRDCIDERNRKLYGGKGFPNCAATVEDGSLCWDNDACKSASVVYDDMQGCWVADCRIAWR